MYRDMKMSPKGQEECFGDRNRTDTCRKKIPNVNAMPKFLRFLFILTICVIGFPLHGQDIRIEGTVGYRQTGFDLTLTADRVVNYRSFGSTSGTLRLTLWASNNPYFGGTIVGWRLGNVTLGQLNGGFQFSNINRTTDLLAIPPIGGEYFLTMTLEEWGGTEYFIVDWVSFSTKLRTFPLEFEGFVRYEIRNESSIRLEVDKIVNPRTDSNTSGGMRIELWALNAPYVNETSLNNGFLMGRMTSSTLSGGWERSNIGATVPFTKPPVGDYYVVMVLRELMFSEYIVQDWRTFGQMLTILPVTDTFEIKGTTRYLLTPNNLLTFSADGIANQYPFGSSAVDLTVSLWATEQPYTGGTLSGWLLGSGTVGGLAGGTMRQNFTQTMSLMNEPPAGTYPVVMALERRVGNDYFIVGWRNFDAQMSFATILSLTPETGTYGNTGANSRQLTVSSNTDWTVSTNVPWLTIVSGETGSGNGVVVYNVAANPGPSRSGQITVSGGGYTATFEVDQTESPPLAWDTGWQPLDNGFRSLEWFGSYVPFSGDILWHSELGFLHVPSTSRMTLIYFYDFSGLGWVATTPDAYPSLFRFADQSWLWYETGSNNPRRFYNLTAGEWE